MAAASESNLLETRAPFQAVPPKEDAPRQRGCQAQLNKLESEGQDTELGEL